MSIEYLENNHEKTHHHGDHQEGEGEHGHGDMVALLKGVDVLLGRKFGPHFSRDFHQAGVKLKITAIENIEEAVLAFIKEKI
jgi:predicted Fe-Mo cluster-binding NifX family protein